MTLYSLKLIVNLYRQGDWKKIPPPTQALISENKNRPQKKKKKKKSSYIFPLTQVIGFYTEWLQPQHSVVWRALKWGPETWGNECPVPGRKLPSDTGPVSGSRQAPRTPSDLRAVSACVTIRSLLWVSEGRRKRSSASPRGNQEGAPSWAIFLDYCAPSTIC